MKAPYEIKFVAKIENKDWPHFLWSVTIGSERFDYKTGLGHFTPYCGETRYGTWGGKRNQKPENGLACSELQGWLHKPTIDTVLDCLFRDAQCGAMSFDEFCADLGYSNDSLKALDVYRACAETSTKLHKALGVEYSSERERMEALEL